MLALISAYWPMIAVTFLIGLVTGRMFFWPRRKGDK